MLFPLVLVALVVIRTHESAAQAPMPQTIPASWHSLPSDTGRMMRQVNFARYHSASQCLAAVGRLSNLLRRNPDGDTLTYDAIVNSTPPPVIVDITRACLRQLDVSKLAPRELYPAMVLELAVGNDAGAHELLAKRLALATTDSARANVWFYAARIYNGARPRRAAAFDSALRRLDAFGTIANGPRIAAHSWLHDHALLSFNTPVLKREAAIIQTLWNTTPQAVRESHGGGSVYSGADQSTLAALTFEDLATVSPFIARRTAEDPNGYYFKMTDPQRRMLGQLAPPLDAKYWYGTNGTASRPTMGKVSLLIDVKTMNGTPAYYAMLRRLHKKYGSQGLEITLVGATEGFTGWSASPPQSADEETAAAEWYVFDHLKLPVGLVIEDRPPTWASDGRRVNAQTSFVKRYMSGSPLVVDRAGRVRCLSWLGTTMMEAQIDACVRRTIEESDGASTSGSHPARPDTVAQGAPRTERRVVTMPFRTVRGFILVDAVINGQSGVLMLDTGAPQLIINSDRLSPKGGTIAAQAEVGATGTQSLELGSVDRLEWGTRDSLNRLVLDHVPAGFTGLTPLENQLGGVPVLGILGRAQLSEHELVLDYRAQKIAMIPLDVQGNRIGGASALAGYVAGDTIALTAGAEDGAPMMTLQIGKTAMSLLLDTGAPVNALPWDQRDVLRAEMAVVQDTTLPWEQSTRDLWTTKPFQAGKITFTNVPWVLQRVGVVGYPFLQAVGRAAGINLRAGRLVQYR